MGVIAFFVRITFFEGEKHYNSIDLAQYKPTCETGTKFISQTQTIKFCYM